MVNSSTIYIILMLVAITTSCKKNEDIKPQAATVDPPAKAIDPWGNVDGGTTTTGGNSGGFYDYSTGGSTGGGITTGGGTTGGGITTGGATDGGTTGGGNINPDQYAQQVRDCNNIGKIYQRSKQLCNPSWNISATFPCTQEGIIAEFLKKNWTISPEHFAGYMPNQCGFDVNNNPVALLVNSDYTMERVFSI